MPDVEEELVYFVLDPSNPPRLTEEEKRRLDALTDEEIEAAALADPDALPLTPDMLVHLALTGFLREARTDLGLSQAAFEALFGLDANTISEWEIGHFDRRSPAEALIKIIVHNSQTAARAFAAASEDMRAAAE